LQLCRPRPASWECSNLVRARRVPDLRDDHRRDRDGRGRGRRASARRFVQHLRGA